MPQSAILTMGYQNESQSRKWGLVVSRIPSLVLSVLGTALLVGCGGGGSPSSTGSGSAGGGGDVAAPAPAPAEQPASDPAPLADGFVVGTNMEDGFPQLDAIATNFSLAGALQPAWGTGDIPVEGAPTDPGAFRFLCQASHLAYDDPIVFPGQKGRSHLHMFFGNTLADADSDYKSLRTSGESTCNNALNRSAYWMPALMNGRGQVVMPDYIQIYYKRFPQGHAACALGKGCIGLPRGLRFVFGRTMSGGETGHVHFACDNPGTPMVATATLAEAAKGCPIGARIGAVAEAPDCWDGVNLDSPDHRAHMANSIYTPPGKVCPASHPYMIPAFTLGAWFTVDATLDRSGDMSPDADTWYFASDRMPGMAPKVSGTTFHSDWYGAWDDPTMDKWIANCIDKRLNCSGGLLGNGEIITHSAAFTAARPHLVAAPARGATVWLFPDP